jgi:hypothetical protein
MFQEAKQAATIKKLKARVKVLMAINKEHQMMNGKLRSELEIERKNHTLTREGEVTTSQLNAYLKQQLHTDREKHEKEMALVREDNQLLNMENGRMMKKLQH